MITLTLDITNMLKLIVEKYRINIQIIEHKTFLAMRAVSNNCCCHKEFKVHFNGFKDSSELLDWINSINRWDNLTINQLKFYFRHPEYDINVEDDIIIVTDIGQSETMINSGVVVESKVVNGDKESLSAPFVNKLEIKDQQLILDYFEDIKLKPEEYDFTKSYGTYDRMILYQSWFNLKEDVSFIGCMTFKTLLFRLSMKEFVKQSELKVSDEYTQAIKLRPIQGQKYIGSSRFYDFTKSYNKFILEMTEVNLKDCDFKMLEMVYR